MAAALAFSMHGVERAEQRLQSVAKGLIDRRELTDAIGLYLESSTIDRFDDGVAPDGSKWPESLRVKEEGGKTLIDHSILRGSIAYNADNDQVEWGSNLIYAGPHQFGATIMAKGGGHLKFRLPGKLGFRSVLSVTIPARPFLGVNAEDEDQIVGLGEDYVAGLDPGIVP